MPDDVYDRLAEALDRLPNGFPRTPSNTEIPLLKRIFSPEEAQLAAQLSGKAEPCEAIARRIGRSVKQTRTELMAMVRRGLVWIREEGGERRFRLAPFVVGIYEAQLHQMDHELAHLVERYLADGGAAGIMGPEPALHRVIPAHGSVKSEWILPYDDVREILLAARSFRVRDCICRVQQDQVGRRCDFPLKVCMSFSLAERPPDPDSLSQEEALELLDETERLGLVHTVSNVMEGVNYICNCCSCCCGILRGITDWGVENSVAQANYFAQIDPEQCRNCGRCEERCQMGAISEQDGVRTVARGRCIGCGLCVTGCPRGAVVLEPKPEVEQVHPPVHFAAWEEARRTHRGLTG